MLKKRVITALLLLPLVLLAIFALPAEWFFIVLAIVLLGGSWEYRRLAGVSAFCPWLVVHVLTLAVDRISFQCRVGLIGLFAGSSPQVTEYHCLHVSPNTEEGAVGLHDVRRALAMRRGLGRPETPA